MEGYVIKWIKCQDVPESEYDRLDVQTTDRAWSKHAYHHTRVCVTSKDCLGLHLYTPSLTRLVYTDNSDQSGSLTAVIWAPDGKPSLWQCSCIPGAVFKGVPRWPDNLCSSEVFTSRHSEPVSLGRGTTGRPVTRDYYPLSTYKLPTYWTEHLFDVDYLSALPGARTKRPTRRKRGYWQTSIHKGGVWPGTALCLFRFPLYSVAWMFEAAAADKSTLEDLRLLSCVTVTVGDRGKYVCDKWDP